MLTALTDIIRIAYLPNGSFVLPIISRLQGSSNAQVRALAKAWNQSELSLLGASLSTKATMLGQLSRRLFSPIIPLTTELSQSGDIGELLESGKGWIPGQRGLPYEALLELDSFIFEFRSAYEILKNFLLAFSSRILGKPIGKSELMAVLTDADIPIEWIEELQRHRNFLIHEQAPWIVFRVKQVEPPELEAVFLAHVDADPTNPTESIDIKTLSRIYSGFDRSLQELQKWAIAAISKLETPPAS
jgi:hypothetical protein